MDTCYKTTYFEDIFSNDYDTETPNAKFDAVKDHHADFKVNISWSTRNIISHKKVDGGKVRRYRKVCNGFVYCTNDSCKFYNKQLRPAVDLERAMSMQLEKRCRLCGRWLHLDSTCDETAQQNGNVEFKLAVGIFHVYAQQPTCQIEFNPRYIEGFGLTHGESMGRLWSSLDKFVPMTRPMSKSSGNLHFIRHSILYGRTACKISVRLCIIK